MRVLVPILALSFLVPTTGDGATEVSPNDLVRELGARFDRGIRARDYDAIAAIYAADALYVQDDGPIRRGRDEIRLQWISDIEDFGLRDMHLEPVRVEIHGDAIVEVGNGISSLASTSPDGSTKVYHFKYVNVWTRAADGGYLLSVDAYSGLSYAAGSADDHVVLEQVSP